MPVALIRHGLRQGRCCAAGSRAALAALGLGVGVKVGAPLPDVSDCPSAAPGRSRPRARSCISRRPARRAARERQDLRPLGLADALGRASRSHGRRLPAACHDREREAEIGIFPRSEIADAAAGVALAGAVPATLQLTIHYGAGVTVASRGAGSRQRPSPLPGRAGEARRSGALCGFDPPIVRRGARGQPLFGVITAVMAAL